MGEEFLQELLTMRSLIFVSIYTFVILKKEGNVQCGGITLSRKWMWYYVIIIVVFLIGRYAMIGYVEWNNGQAEDWLKTFYFIWVNAFALLFLGPAFRYGIKRWIKLISENVKSKGLRIFTLAYSVFFLVLIFIGVYYTFVVSF